MDKETLIKFGLTKREAEVYYSLLCVEEALASEICEKTNESRTNTYDTLNSLIKKGLVSHVIKSNKKYFMATDPKKLIEWIEIRKDEIEREKELAEKLIPELLKLKLPNQKKVIVEVYEGKEGLRTMLQETVDSAKKTKSLLIFGAISGHLRQLDPIYHKRYFKERAENKIKTRYIFIEGEEHPTASNSEYRYLPKIYKSFAATAVHGEEVSFWLLTDPAVVILVKSKEFAETYASNFEALWGIAKKR